MTGATRPSSPTSATASSADALVPFTLHLSTLHSSSDAPPAPKPHDAARPAPIRHPRAPRRADFHPSLFTLRSSTPRPRRPGVPHCRPNRPTHRPLHSPPTSPPPHPRRWLQRLLPPPTPLKRPCPGPASPRQAPCSRPATPPQLARRQPLARAIFPNLWRFFSNAAAVYSGCRGKFCDGRGVVALAAGKNQRVEPWRGVFLPCHEPVKCEGLK